MIRIASCAVTIVCILAVFGPPGRYVVEGLSMAPGLRPGDVVQTGWLPQFERLRQPRRHERWIVVSPDGVPAIKRVAGLPGETISIRDGDLAIGGTVVVTPPGVLEEMASVVPECVIDTHDDGIDGGWHRTVSVSEVLDEASFAPDERRLLLPVRDVGLAAVIGLRRPTADDGAIRVRLRVGRFVVPWKVRADGRYAMVAGRLDGHLVGVAWPLSNHAGPKAGAGRIFPPRIPQDWDVARPCRDDAPSDTGERPPPFAIGISKNAVAMPLADVGVTIEQVVVWRDTLYRPAADGSEEWKVGAGRFFVLGDFPSGSRDSRHWGPLARSAFCSPASLRP